MKNLIIRLWPAEAIPSSCFGLVKRLVNACPRLDAIKRSVRESWIRGYPGSRTIYIVRTIEASRYKTREFGLCPDGTLLCVEDKLGEPDIMFPSL